MKNRNKNTQLHVTYQAIRTLQLVRKVVCKAKAQPIMFQTTNICTDNFCANQKYIKQHFLNTDLYICNIIVFALNCSVQLVFKSSRSFHHRPETKVLFKQVEPLVFVCYVCVCSYTHLTSLLVNKPTLSNCSTAGILSSNRCCTISAISKRLWGKSSDKCVRYSEFYQNNEP